MISSEYIVRHTRRCSLRSRRRSPRSAKSMTWPTPRSVSPQLPWCRVAERRWGACYFALCPPRVLELVGRTLLAFGTSSRGVGGALGCRASLGSTVKGGRRKRPTGAFFPPFVTPWTRTRPTLASVTARHEATRARASH
jgi:hypothetical protein